VQKLVEARVGRVESQAFWQQINALGISHILTDRPTSMSSGVASVNSAIGELHKLNCLIHVKEILTPWKRSRTVPLKGIGRLMFDIWKLNTKTCLVDIRN
jgi:hypothetical protein